MQRALVFERLLALLVSLPLTPALATPAVTPLAELGPARVVQQSARWAGLATLDALGSEADTMFVISGEIENHGATPIAAVKLRYELLADDGDGERVLASEYGYNLRAEALREPAVEAGTVRPERLHLPAIAPGERDLFRMTFFRAEVPRFARWRVRILAVQSADGGWQTDGSP